MIKDLNEVRFFKSRDFGDETSCCDYDKNFKKDLSKDAEKEILNFINYIISKDES